MKWLKRAGLAGVAVAVVVASGAGGAFLAASYPGGSGSAQDAALRAVTVQPPDGSVDLAMAPEASTESVKAADAVIERAVIRTAAVAIRVDDVDASLGSLRTTVASANGQIESLAFDAGRTVADGTQRPNVAGPKSATVVIRVPEDELGTITEKLGSLGSVTSQSASEQDVTQQKIDIDARLKNLRAEEARVRGFLSEAKNVRDLLSVEQELGRLRGEIESLQAQADYLSAQTSLATLTVELSEPGAVVSPASGGWGLAQAVTDGVRGAVRIVNVFVTVAIAAAPIVLLVLAAWLIFRRFARRDDTAADHKDGPVPAA